jgi:hypothetical protein
MQSTSTASIITRQARHPVRRTAGAAKLRAAAVRLGAALALAIVSSAAPVHAQDEFIVTIHSSEGLCLDIEGASSSDGATVLVYGCHRRDNQSFELRLADSDRDDEWFTARAEHSGQCLDIKSNSRGTGANLIQWPCHGRDNQSFDFRPVSRGSNVGEIRVMHSGLCLDAGSNRERSKVTQQTCNGSSQQRWTIIR